MVDKASHKQQPLNSIPGDVLFIRKRVREGFCVLVVLFACCFEAGHNSKAAVSARLVASRLVSLQRINDDFLKLLGSAV